MFDDYHGIFSSTGTRLVYFGANFLTLLSWGALLGVLHLSHAFSRYLFLFLFLLRACGTDGACEGEIFSVPGGDHSGNIGASPPQAIEHCIFHSHQQ